MTKDELIAYAREQYGTEPEYLMNKTHWLGVLLDGSAADETVTELLDLSYAQTKPRKKR